jgi:hypothetical protein
MAKAAEQAGRHDWRRVLPGFGRDVLILTLASAFAYWIRKPYAAPNSGYQALEWREAILGWFYLLRDYYVTGSTLWLLIAPAAVGVAALVYTFVYKFENLRENRTAIRAFAVGQFTLFFYAAIAGASLFAKWMGFPRRYLIPSLMIWMVCWVGLTLHLFPLHLKLPVRARWLGGLALVMVISVVRFGPPSLGAVKSSLDTRFGSTYSQVEKSCTHLAGDYYRVWDSVFYSMIKHDRQLWGITYRSQVIYDLWDTRKFQNPRICYWQNNEMEAQKLIRDFQITGLQKIAEHDGLVILERPSAVVAR